MRPSRFVLTACQAMQTMCLSSLWEAGKPVIPVGRRGPMLLASRRVFGRETGFDFRGRGVGSVFGKVAMVAVALVVLVGLGLPACEDEPAVPTQEELSQEKPKIDTTHVAYVRADRTFTVPTLMLVLQIDAGESMAVSLASRIPGPDGSRLLFGTWQPASKLTELAGMQLDFASSPVANIRGNGIFTAVSFYQPKLAAVFIDEANEREARGRISGEFYQLRSTGSTGRPEIVQVEADFVAEILIR